MKSMRLALVYLGVAMLATGCGGGGGSSSGGSVSIPTAAVQITQTNAAEVAKSANSSAQGMAKTGSSTAGIVGVVAQPSGFTHSVLDISLAKFAKIRNLQLSQNGGAVGVIAGFPISGPCAVSGTMSMDINDANNNGTVDSGDTITMSLNQCDDGLGTVDNGSMSFSISGLSGPLGGTGTPSAPLTASFTLTFSNLSSYDQATMATDTINGDITFSTSDDGTNTTGIMYGTSLSMSNSVDGAFLITNYNISFTEANVTGPSSPFSFSFSMTTASTIAGGSVTITTSPAFTGFGNGNPTAGQMVITGANNSTLTMTAQSDGTHVGIVVDDDGAAGPNAPVTITNPATGQDYTWADL